MLKAIDLCGGAGGWSVAARGLPLDVVLAVDYWEPACQTYALNHPHCKVWQMDLTKRETAERIVEYARSHGVSVVLGGVPCEWLSIMRRDGMHNGVSEIELTTGRALLDNILWIVRELQPRYWCLEDVVGLIKELPPLTPYEILDAAGWSPQRRKRAFVGQFPKPANPRDTRTLKDAIRPGPYRIGPRGAQRIPQRSRTFGTGTCHGAWLDDKAPTVIVWGSRRDGDVVVVDESLVGGQRQFEWQEGAILQGFPEDYVFWGSPRDVSMMVGRAIQITLGHAILKQMTAALVPVPTAT